MTVDLRHGNCLDILPTLPDCSVDSIVTDPPYELGFMGKKWDNSGIAYNVTLWQECLRVLKPGGHLLAFGGTRTYHRMACAIEDAGFEIRDSIHWLYGSGFPKSLDVSKAIDKMDASEEQKKRQLRFTTWVRSTGVKVSEVTDVLRSTGLISENGTMAGHYFAKSADAQPAVMTREHLEACRHLFSDIPAWVERECDIRSVESRNMAEREIIGMQENAMSGWNMDGTTKFVDRPITIANTEQAKQWAGWGTALKPAHEPIVVARKPLVGTVAANVLQYGTGAINIDGCRIGTDQITINTFDNGAKPFGGAVGEPYTSRQVAGRWPANVILTHHDTCQQVGLKDDVFGGGAKATSGFVNGYDHDGFVGQSVSVPVWECVDGCPVALLDEQSEGASRFFYCAKPSRRERNAGLDHLEAGHPIGGSDKWTEQDRRRGEGVTRTPTANVHPTVKPLALMRYLVRLVTPPNGIVLEPFAGSGTTLMACVLENFHAIGIEMTDEYLPIIEGRIAWAEQEASKESPQQELEL